MNAVPGRIGVVAAAGLGRNRMILHREGEIGPVHGALLLCQLGEGVMGMQFVQHVTVDIDELAAVGALADAVEVPDLVEQSARHGVPTRLGRASWAGLSRKASGERASWYRTDPCPKSSVSIIWF